MKILVERLIRADHVRRYVREIVHRAKTAPAIERIAANAELPSEPWPTINYILGGPVDDQFHSKRQKRRLLQVTTARSQVNTIHISNSNRVIQPINSPISFPPVNPSRVITLYHDALVLTLCINNFDVHRVLVYPSSAANLNISFNRLS